MMTLREIFSFSVSSFRRLVERNGEWISIIALIIRAHINLMHWRRWDYRTTHEKYFAWCLRMHFPTAILLPWALSTICFHAHHEYIIYYFFISMYYDMIRAILHDIRWRFELRLMRFCFIFVYFFDILPMIYLLLYITENLIWSTKAQYYLGRPSSEIHLFHVFHSDATADRRCFSPLSWHDILMTDDSYWMARYAALPILPNLARLHRYTLWKFWWGAMRALRICDD